MRERHDGFTGEKRKRFLKTLGKTGCIKDAAKAAGISTTTVDRWRRKDARFAKLCEVELERAGSRIETLAWERAVTGIEEPIWYHGKVVGTRIRRSDGIFRMLMIGSNRKKYGRMGAVGRKQIEREVRAKIEEERNRLGGRRRARTTEELRAIILAKMEAHDEMLKRIGYRPPEEGEEGGGD